MIVFDVGTIADELRTAVENSGLSQAEVARKAGLQQPTLNRFMRGEFELSLSNAQALADFFSLELKPRTMESGKK